MLSHPRLHPATVFDYGVLGIEGSVWLPVAFYSSDLTVSGVKVHYGCRLWCSGYFGNPPAPLSLGCLFGAGFRGSIGCCAMIAGVLFTCCQSFLGELACCGFP